MPETKGLLRAEPARLVAVQPLGVPTPVRKLMEGRPIIVDLIAEGRLRRDSHEIGAGRIIGFGIATHA